MTDISQVIDAKIKELQEKIKNENEELEKTKSFKYKDKCKKIALVSAVAATIALTYVLIVVSDTKESMILLAVIMIAYTGVSAIPHYVFNNVQKRIAHIGHMESKIEGFDWLKTRAPDQQENMINIMKNWGLF